MLAAVKGQVLGEGQGDPRRQEAFHARRVRQGKEHDCPGQGTRFPEISDKEFRNIMLDPHRGKNDGKLDLLVQEPRLPDDLGGHPVVRQTVAGKHRELLAAHERVHPVDGG